MGKAEYIMPKECEICGSDDLAIRAYFDKEIIRYVCCDCGNSRAIPKVNNLQKRTNSTVSHWSARVIKHHPFCAICGSKENLEAHHIIPVSHSRDFMYYDTNGITLCKKHHQLVHQKGGPNDD